MTKPTLMVRMVVVVVLLTLALALGTGGCDEPRGRRSPTGTGTGTGTVPDAQLVDLNSASERELEQLPGIGEAYARRIIANRPYASKTQLVSRGIVPDSAYEKCRELVIARQH